MPTNAKVHRWSEVPAEELNPLLTRQFISGEQTTVAQIALKKGAFVPAHAHINEQVSIVIAGSMRFVMDPAGTAEEFLLAPGQVLVIPPNLPHSAEALEDSLNMDVFTPIRQDWISGADAYLR